MFITPPITSIAGECKTNSACCQDTSIAVAMKPMAIKRRNLSTEELEDAERLKQLLAVAKKDKGLTQERVGLLCGYSGQQAVQAYASGGTPINLDAAYRFAKALDVTLEEISPRLAARAVELFGATQAAHDRPQTIEALVETLQDDINKADNDIRMAIAGLVKAYNKNPAEGERIARSIRALLGEL